MCQIPKYILVHCFKLIEVWGGGGGDTQDTLEEEEKAMTRLITEGGKGFLRDA